MKTQHMIVWTVSVLSTFAIMATAPTAFAKAKAKSDAPAPAAKAEKLDTNVPPAGAPGSEKLDVSDLENKYWAPKDTDFSVVQNRTFTKEHKWFVSGQFGPDITGGNYLSGNFIGGSVNYFMNERYGFQATYLSGALHSNAAVGDLLNKGGFPNYGIIQDYYGLGFNWVPFYSKMSFLGKKILYFDMAITPTLGWTDYTQQISTGNSNQGSLTYGIDITQYYFFTSHFAIRVDLKNQWWNEKVVQYVTNGTTRAGDTIKDSFNREMIFLLGFTYYFGL